jgi:23S rRNA (uracil1939-C5)-methyltransferase
MSSVLHPSGETLLLQIEKLVHGGAGLAHDGSRAVFVPHVLPGESVRVLLNRSRKGYAEAHLVEVVTPSPDRVGPPCPVYGQCGGCQLQHIALDAQLRLKREILAETLARVGGLGDLEVPPLIASPADFGYRNRARFAVFHSSSGSSLAYYEERSHRLVPISECLLLSPLLNEILKHLNALLPHAEQMGLQEVSVAASFTTGEVVIHYCAERATRQQAHAWFARVREGRPVKGQVLISGRGRQSRRWAEGDLTSAEMIGGCRFRISEGAFAQANWKLNESLAQTVKNWALEGLAGLEASAGLKVLELYAGIGNFGLLIARAGALVTLVEGNRTALADARENARFNHIGRCRFRAVSAEEILTATTPGEYDLVLLDPPRTGLSKETVTGVLRLMPKRMLYVSCDPPTLARDLRALQNAGYRISRLQGYDMFPQTMHIETLVELIRDVNGLYHEADVALGQL